jgi:hypothetical protein
MPRTVEAPPPYQVARKYRRFDLQFPVCLSFPAGKSVREIDAVSKNVSIGGLLLRTDNRIPPRTRVSLTMHVQGPWFRRPVRLHGEGKVVRVEKLGPGAGFAIAVECTQSITEMEDHLSAAS